MKKKMSGIIIILLFSVNVINASNIKVDSSQRASITSENFTTEKLYSENYLMNSFAAQLYINKGLYKQAGQDHHSAILNFQEALKLNPGSYEAYTLMGESKATLGLTTEAMEAFDKAIDLNPFYGDAYFKKASLSKANGNYHEAYKNYSLAIHLDPAYKHVYVQKDLDAISYCNFIKKHYQLKVWGR